MDQRWASPWPPTDDPDAAAIGVTTPDASQQPGDDSSPRRAAHPEMALGMTYLRTLDAVGVIPVVLPLVGTDHLLAAPEIGSTASALRRPGPGPGRLRTRRTVTTSPARRSRASTRRAVPPRGRRSPVIPILAIRRGPQARDVACGGRWTSTVEGDPPDRRDDGAHGTRSRSKAGSRRTASRAHAARRQLLHHQAVDKFGEAEVVARARDDGHRRRHRGPGSHGRRGVARGDAVRRPGAVRGAGQGGRRYRTADRRMTPWGGCPPCASVALSSVSGT